MARRLCTALMALALAFPLAGGCQKVTKSQCDKVKNGMDITQVAKVLGNRGEEKPTGSTAGVEVTQRKWSNSDGTACDVLFRRGKVYKTIWTK